MVDLAIALHIILATPITLDAGLDYEVTNPQIQLIKSFDWVALCGTHGSQNCFQPQPSILQEAKWNVPHHHTADLYVRYSLV